MPLIYQWNFLSSWVAFFSIPSIYFSAFTRWRLCTEMGTTCTAHTLWSIKAWRYLWYSSNILWVMVPGKNYFLQKILGKPICFPYPLNVEVVKSYKDRKSFSLLQRWSNKPYATFTEMSIPQVFIFIIWKSSHYLKTIALATQHIHPFTLTKLIPFKWG